MAIGADMQANTANQIQTPQVRGRRSSADPFVDQRQQSNLLLIPRDTILGRSARREIVGEQG